MYRFWPPKPKMKYYWLFWLSLIDFKLYCYSIHTQKKITCQKSFCTPPPAEMQEKKTIAVRWQRKQNVARQRAKHRAYLHSNKIVWASCAFALRAHTTTQQFESRSSSKTHTRHIRTIFLLLQNLPRNSIFVFWKLWLAGKHSHNTQFLSFFASFFFVWEWMSTILIVTPRSSLSHTHKHNHTHTRAMPTRSTV